MIWQDLIDRARTYVDDDHDDVKGWITPARWLTLANVEYALLYRKWVRTGLVTPAATDSAFTGSTKALTGVLAVVGVAENTGTYKRLLQPSQSVLGRAPVWSDPTAIGKSSTWSASGSGDAVDILLDPVDATGSYIVRWIPAPVYATDPTTAVVLPYGGDERMALGMARRAHIKDSTASALLERLVAEADAEMNFTAFGRLDSDAPRVRRVKPSVRPTLDSTPRWTWFYR